MSFLIKGIDMPTNCYECPLNEYVSDICDHSECLLVEVVHGGWSEGRYMQPSQWIPVNERLPEENGKYLVTGRRGAVSIIKFEDGRWYGKGGVLAWMPLPYPWKGEEDADSN